MTQLLLAPASRALHVEPLAQSEIPVVWARWRCLYGPPAMARSLLRELGYERVQIDVGDEVLALVETA